MRKVIVQVGRKRQRPVYLSVDFGDQATRQAFQRMIDELVGQEKLPKGVEQLVFEGKRFVGQVLVAVPPRMRADDIVEAVTRAAAKELSVQLDEERMLAPTYEHCAFILSFQRKAG